jgi:hypothetical protein
MARAVPIALAFVALSGDSAPSRAQAPAAGGAATPTVTAAPTPTPTPPSPPAYETPSVFSLDTTTPQTFTINYRTARIAGTGLYQITNGTSGTSQLTINGSAPTGIVPGSVTVTMEFTFGKNKVSIKARPNPPVVVVFDPNKKSYVVSQTQLNSIAQVVVAEIDSMKSGFDADTPVLMGAPAKITFTPTQPAGPLIRRWLPSNLGVYTHDISAGTVPVVMKEVIP